MEQEISRKAVQYGAGTRAQSAAVDEGLRAHMLNVYNYMTVALAVTGFVALLTFKAAVVGDVSTGQFALTALGETLYLSPLRWVVMLAPLGFIIFLSARISAMSTATAQMTFWAFAGIMGLSLSSIFISYTGESITRVFFITAAMFGSLSLYGYTTKRDLSGMGTFLFMALIGLIIAMVVNWFMQSEMMAYIISIVGVLLFAGLTVWDTQMIKNLYLGSRENEETVGKLAIMGALRLYLDFLNMFLFLLRLFGNRN